jgi:hypothetical protein
MTSPVVEAGITPREEVADVVKPGTEVLIRAGLPGEPSLKVDHGRPYPNTTTDMAKLIAERGLTVAVREWM